MRAGSTPDDIAEMVCEVGEGTVHRLWEPLAEKQRPPNGYAAKFCDALRHRRSASSRAISASMPSPMRRSAMPPCARWPPRCATEIDPGQSLSATRTPATSARALRDGRVVEERQPHLRGGAGEPLSRAELEAKAPRPICAPVVGPEATLIEPTLALGSQFVGRSCRSRALLRM